MDEIQPSIPAEWTTRTGYRLIQVSSKTTRLDKQTSPISTYSRLVATAAQIDELNAVGYNE